MAKETYQEPKDGYFAGRHVVANLKRALNSAIAEREKALKMYHRQQYEMKELENRVKYEEALTETFQDNAEAYSKMVAAQRERIEELTNIVAMQYEKITEQMQTIICLRNGQNPAALPDYGRDILEA